MGKSEAKTVIKKLISNFQDHLDSYKKSSYNESTLRIDFLNKFFKALGWDVDNEEGLTPSFRQVVTEDKVLVEGRKKSPDYSFRIKNGTRQFFVEAKKPEVNISTHTPSAFQLRRYGWNADIGVSVLTSFEYFAVYDCSSKPIESQPASFSRLKLIHFEEYLDSFDYIWETFSREAVISGSLDKFKITKNKKGSSSVDNDFLKSLDGWRENLANDIFRNNEIEEFQLNFVVQKIIDQIIFLRIAEDRDIEPYGALKKLCEADESYQDFLKICSKANDKYNSGLFLHDNIFQSLKISNKTFSGIIKELYFPVSPYEFSIMPLDILGKAYEQFLGKVIVVDKKKKLSVAEKPEVKKAGGVFYTPKYIVESIVEDTVGKLVENKSLDAVEKLKILDPACGSGTFLLTAFEYLLNWYKKYYEINKTKLSKRKLQEILTPEGELTTNFKGKVLLNNIFGVDVDRNAVEVTKLSLLLKCLEGENKDSLNAQMSFFQERVLPTLDQNIVSGNSLVDYDIYGTSPDLEFDLRIKRKINAFNWETSFRDIFRDSGGFHVVIGNPPYVRQELFSDLKPYFNLKFKVYNGVADLYTYFFEQSYRIMAKQGLFSIIVANKWFRAKYGEQLRIWLKTVCLETIIDFGDLPVFENATTYPCIIKIKKTKAEKNFLFSDLIKQGVKNPRDFKSAKFIKIEFKQLSEHGWVLADQISLNVIEQMKSIGMPFLTYVKKNVYRGIVTGKNDAFVITEEIRKKLIKRDRPSIDIIKPFVEGKDVKAYSQIKIKNFLIFTRRGINIEKYAGAKEHLELFKKQLMPKPKNWKPKDNEKWPGRKSGDYRWYEIQDSIEYYKEFEKTKIIYPSICKQPQFTLDQAKLYTNDKCFIIPLNDLYLLGVLNSDLTYFWCEMHLPRLRGGYFEMKIPILKNLPICDIDSSKPALLEEKNKIIDCVKKLLAIDSKGKNKESQNECLFYKNEINKSVYKIYDIGQVKSKHISEILENVKR